MSPDQVDARLPVLDNGSLVVTLMSDPNLAQDGFLSIVDKGANGRRFQVVKAEDMPKPANAEKGGGLASTLNGRIDELTSDERTRASIVDEMASAAGISSSTVNQILRGDIETPPNDRLAGFAKVLDLSAESLQAMVGKAEDLQPLVETTLDLGQTSGWMSWWRRIWAPVLGGAVSKAEAVPFDEAVAVPRVFDRLYEGFDALLHSIASIMNDETVPDKQAAVEMALSQYAVFVADAFQFPTLKSEQQAKVSAYTQQIWGQVVARKQADQLAVADASAIFAAHQAIGQAQAALSTLAAKAASTASVTHTTEGPMNPTQLQAVADAAASSAIKAARAANPAATPAELQAVGVSASQEVFKMAVMGPKQPALPGNNLANQIDMSRGGSGSPKDPTMQFDQAIRRLTSLTSKFEKVEKALFGDRDEQGNVPEGGDPGILGVVEAVVKTQKGLAERVQKVAGTPAPSRQSPKQPEPTIVAKQADDDGVWAGSAFSLID